MHPLYTNFLSLILLSPLSLALAFNLLQTNIDSYHLVFSQLNSRHAASIKSCNLVIVLDLESNLYVSILTCCS